MKEAGPSLHGRDLIVESTVVGGTCGVCIRALELLGYHSWMQPAGRWRNLCAVRFSGLRVPLSSISILPPDMDPLLRVVLFPYPVLSEPTCTSLVTMTSVFRQFLPPKISFFIVFTSSQGSSSNSRVQVIFPSSHLLRPISLLACNYACLFSFIALLFSMDFNCSHESSLYPN